MVFFVVDCVNTNGIDTKILELLDIAEADISIGERIFISRRATGLIVDATKVESVFASVKGWISCQSAHPLIEGA